MKAGTGVTRILRAALTAFDRPSFLVGIRRLRRGLPLLVLLPFLAAGCATGAPSSRDAEIERLARSFVASVSAGDLDRFLSFFAPEASAFLPSEANAAGVVGLPAIRAAVTPFFGSGPTKAPLVAKDLRVESSDDLAVATFDAGRADVGLHSRRTLVFRRVGGEWKVIHLHASNLREEAKEGK
jgi:ketosteroid isomerase-like protein